MPGPGYYWADEAIRKAKENVDRVNKEKAEKEKNKPLTIYLPTNGPTILYLPKNEQEENKNKPEKRQSKEEKGHEKRDILARAGPGDPPSWHDMYPGKEMDRKHREEKAEYERKRKEEERRREEDFQWSGRHGTGSVVVEKRAPEELGELENQGEQGWGNMSWSLGHDYPPPEKREVEAVEGEEEVLNVSNVNEVNNANKVHRINKANAMLLKQQMEKVTELLEKMKTEDINVPNPQDHPIVQMLETLTFLTFFLLIP